MYIHSLMYGNPRHYCRFEKAKSIGVCTVTGCNRLSLTDQVDVFKSIIALHAAVVVHDCHRKGLCNLASAQVNVRLEQVKRNITKPKLICRHNNRYYLINRFKFRTD